MVVTIISETIEPWLKYIWEQFAYINSLHTDYRLATYSDTGIAGNQNDTNIVIEYGIKQRFPYSFFIPSKKEFRTDDYVWVRDDLPVYRGTIAENGDYDLFYNAFVHLSRLEEWESESRGKLIDSYSFNHPRKDKRIWQLPVVNYLFNELERKIKEKFPPVEFGSGTKPIIEFSHDVDYIEKTVQLRLKQTAFDFFNAGKCLTKRELKGSFSKLKEGVNFVMKKSDYWCFDYWDKLENEFKVKSVYYFFAKSLAGNKYNLKQWLIDPSYDISNNRRLKEKCKELIAGGNKIGLHGSYYSALDEKLFMKEKEVLEKAIDRPITKTRQHWLNYRENITPYIHKRAEIEKDSTIGFNDISGFRAGVASLYNPYDHRNEVSFPFTEMPFAIMDSHLYDYAAHGGVQCPGWLFQSMERVKNFAAAIDWHQRVISRDYGWDGAYKEIAERYRLSENTDLSGETPERTVRV